MAAARSGGSIVETERLVLCALCQGTPEGSVQETAKLVLQNYCWREPLHQLVFNVLVSIPSESPEMIRNHLPARLTRTGFPDVPWEDFFKPHSLSRGEAEHLIEQLAMKTVGSDE